MEEHAVAAPGRTVIDLDSGADSAWCPVLVSPDLLARVMEIAGRTGMAPDAVLVRAVMELDERTR